MEVLLFSLLQLIFFQIKLRLESLTVFLISLQLLEAPQYSLYETVKWYTVLGLLLVVALSIISYLLFAKSKDTDRKVKRLENSLPEIIHEKQKMNILKDGID